MNSLKPREAPFQKAGGARFFFGDVSREILKTSH